jgi:hypothetical protein
MIVISKIDIPNKLTKGKSYVVISRGVNYYHSNSEIKDNELLSGADNIILFINYL